MRTFLALILLCSVNGIAQKKPSFYVDSIYNVLVLYNSESHVNRISNLELVWNQVDSFTVKHYNSAPRDGVRKLDTLKINLTFEEGWDPKRIEKTQSQNAILIQELSNIYLTYMDSIDWKGYKITKNGFESDVVGYLKMKYPVPFTSEQRKKIDQIERCPDFLFHGMGVYLDCNNPGIEEEEIRLSYTHKLKFISLELFGQSVVNYGVKSY